MSEFVLERVITLRCRPAHAFRVFTEMTDLWWPRGHRRTREATVLLEASADGRLLERAPDGTEWVLGHVTTYDPPDRLGFDWFPGSPAAPTSVEVTFRATAGGSEIAIIHRALSGGAIEAWPGKVALFERGWNTILPAIAEYIDSETTG